MVLGTETFAYVPAVVIMSTLAVLLILAGVSPGTWAFMATSFYQACPWLVAIGVIAYMFVVTVWYTVWLPSMALLTVVTTHPILSGGVVLGVLGCLGLGGVITARRTGPAVDWSLLGRMVGSLLLLSVVTIMFITALWRLIEAFTWFWLAIVGIGDSVGTVLDTLVWSTPSFTGAPQATPPSEAFTATAMVMGSLIVVAVWQLWGYTSLEHADAVPVTSDEYPTLHAITTSVAAQLDIPKPAIAVSDRSTPQAVIVGFRPGNTTFLVSRGLLEPLDTDELEAVVAHELAHVANMDSMVMGIVALPTLLLDALSNEHDETSEDESQAALSSATDRSTTAGASSVLIRLARLPVLAIGYCVAAILLRVIPVMVLTLVSTIVFMALLSQPAVAILSRARESAADRTAVRITGSPAVLASALETLDDRIAQRPTADLRDVSTLSSLSILPLDPIDPPSTDQPTERLRRFVTLFRSEQRETEAIWTVIGAGWTRLRWLLLATHPLTTRRIDALTTLRKEET